MVEGLGMRFGKFFSAAALIFSTGACMDLEVRRSFGEYRVDSKKKTAPLARPEGFTLTTEDAENQGCEVLVDAIDAFHGKYLKELRLENDLGACKQEAGAARLPFTLKHPVKNQLRDFEIVLTCTPGGGDETICRTQLFQESGGVLKPWNGQERPLLHINLIHIGATLTSWLNSGGESE